MGIRWCRAGQAQAYAESLDEPETSAQLCFKSFSTYAILIRSIA